MGRIPFDDLPGFDQCTYYGRFRYFAMISDSRLNFVSSHCLDQAKKLRTLYIQGREPQATTRDQLVYAKKLYDSAFHPDSGEKMNIFGRMSFQVPGGMLITGAMLTWYRTVPALVFWQWVNQSFNALVNYTNRNAKSQLTGTQIAVAYVSATTAACATAIGFKNFLMQRASPFWQRYVPFAAVAAANCVNIPLMRQNEILGGIDVYDSNENRVGESRVAATKGISQVIFSRILMCAPGMTLLPVIMNRLEKNCWFSRNQWIHAPFQTMAVGCFLTFMVPAACAVFPQRCSLSSSVIQRFEPEKYDEIDKFTKGKVPNIVYFNKGL